MKVIHVHARIRRKHSNYVKVKPDQVGENILNRNFDALWQNQKWCTDVTEFKVIGQKQKIYLMFQKIMTPLNKIYLIDQ